MGIRLVEQKLLVNTFSQALISYDLITQRFREVLFNSKKVTGRYQIWDIEWVPESDFPIWLATNEGLFIYNEKSNEQIVIPLTKNGEKFPATFSIENTEGDYLWVSSLTALYKLSKKMGEIEEVVTIDGIITSSIQDILIYKNTILVATEGEGIFIYDSEKSDSLIPITKLIPESSTLLTLPIWDLFLDSKNVIWIGTNQGLFKLEIDRSILTKVSLKTLLNRIIFSIVEDQQDNIWMGTEKGLVRFKPKTEEVLEFNKSDGVYNVEYNRRSVARSETGTLYFGGVEGVTVFNPEKVITNPIIPEVHILDVRVITPDSIIIPDGFYEKEIVLPWNSNTLEFDFVGLNYTNPSLNKYRYKLDGHDPDWVESNTNRLARYTQIPHGEYEFSVQSSNNDGVWNKEGSSLLITINPPFWKTRWFRLLSIILFASILWSLYRYRLTKLLELERIKLRIANDLHDEVGSGLSGIALTGDILQRQFEKGDIKPELIQRITKNSRGLASSLDAIVWLIDSKKETIGDLISKSLITAQELIQKAELEIIDTVSKSDQNKTLTSLQRRNLLLLLKEALNNVAKHSNATFVSLTFEVKESELIIRIKDNGLGFDITSEKSGRGLGTMKNRADELMGRFTLNSSAEEGTRISVSVKIP